MRAKCRETRTMSRTTRARKWCELLTLIALAIGANSSVGRIQCNSEASSRKQESILDHRHQDQFPANRRHFLLGRVPSEEASSQLSREAEGSQKRVGEPGLGFDFGSGLHLKARRVERLESEVEARVVEANKLRQARQTRNADQVALGSDRSGQFGALDSEDSEVGHSSRPLTRRRAGMESGPKPVHALLNGQVELGCNLDPADPSDSVSLVLWYKDNSMVPIYRATNNPKEARHKPGSWLEGRSRIELKTNRPRSPENGSDSLLIRDRRGHARPDETSGRAPRDKPNIANLVFWSLGIEDAGLYSCTVDFKRSRSRVQGWQINVVVEPKTPLIRQIAPQPLEQILPSGLVGPFNEDARLVIECESSGGSPAPQLLWWRDGLLVDDSFELLTSDGRPLRNYPAGNSQALGLTLDQFLQRAPLVSNVGLGHRLERPDLTIDTLTRNRLELSGLTRSDLLANYSCQAWNNKLSTSPPASSAIIDLNLGPTKVQIENERGPVQANRRIELLCRAFESRPAASIRWLKAGQLLDSVDSAGEEFIEQTGPHLHQTRLAHRSQQPSPDSDHQDSQRQHNVSQSRILFVPKIEDAGQTISCIAENPALGVDSAIEDTWTLEVNFLPQVKLSLGERISSEHIREGTDVYFECSVRARPSASEVRWWFEGRELDSNLTEGVIISNQSLVLQRVQRTRRGRYSCSAANQLGESQSNSVHLRVLFAPVCQDHQGSNAETLGSKPALQINASGSSTPSFSVKPRNVYGAARLEQVRVFCHVDADPKDSLSFRWAFVPTETGKSTTNQVMSLDESSLSQELAPGSTALGVASYTPRGELDYGTLLCWASNSIGSQQEPCTYRIVPAERPDPVAGCRVANASHSQLVVACKPGYNGGLTQTIRMEVYARDERILVANVSSTKPAMVSKSVVSQNIPPSGDDDDYTRPGHFAPAELPSGTDKYRAHQQQQDEPSRALSAGESASLVLDNHHKSSPATPTPAFTPTSQLQLARLLRPGETFLATEPVLEPSTTYLVSVFASNPKGESAPLAFSASTSKLTSADVVLQSDSSENWRPRKGDSASQSSSSSQGWSPFVAVCLATIVIFIMFASITFALMKYVKFVAGPFRERPHASHNTSPNWQSTSGGSSASGSQASKFESRNELSGSLHRARLINLPSSADQNQDLADESQLNKPNQFLLANAQMGIKRLQSTNQMLCMKPCNSETFLDNIISGSNYQTSNKNNNIVPNCGTLPKNLSSSLRVQSRNWKRGSPLVTTTAFVPTFQPGTLRLIETSSDLGAGPISWTQVGSFNVNHDQRPSAITGSGRQSGEAGEFVDQSLYDAKMLARSSDTTLGDLIIGNRQQFVHQKVAGENEQRHLHMTAPTSLESPSMASGSSSIGTGAQLQLQMGMQMLTERDLELQLDCEWDPDHELTSIGAPPLVEEATMEHDSRNEHHPAANCCCSRPSQSVEIEHWAGQKPVQ